MILNTSPKWMAIFAIGGILLISGLLIGAPTGLRGGPHVILMFIGFIMGVVGFIQMLRHGGRSVRYRPL